MIALGFSWGAAGPEYLWSHEGEPRAQVPLLGRNPAGFGVFWEAASNLPLVGVLRSEWNG